MSLTFLWFALGLSVARGLGDLLDDLHGVLMVLGVVVNFNFVHEHLPSEEKLGLFFWSIQQYFLWEGHPIPQPNSCPMLPAPH